MSQEPILVWGVTGNAVVLDEFLEVHGFRICALIDNNAAAESPLEGVPIYHGVEGFQQWLQDSGAQVKKCCVAIGGRRGRDRVQLQRFLEGHGCQPITVVHPRAFVARTASLGKGSQIFAQAAVCARVTLGEACVVNTSASVDHECVLDEGVHVGPGAALAGCVEVGAYSMISTGASVLPRVRIGRNVMIGAGAVVTRDVPDGKLVVGVPGRIVRDLEV